MRHHLMLVKKTVFQKTEVRSVGKDVGKAREPLPLLLESDRHTHMENSMTFLPKIKNTAII